MRKFACTLAVLALAGCQGSYSTGSSLPPAPPMGNAATPLGAGSTPVAGTTAAPNAGPSSSQKLTVTFATVMRTKSLQCPTVAGFGCELSANAPKLATPSPSPAPKTRLRVKPTARPTATPVTTPAPSPSGGATSPAPNATATPSGPAVELQLTAYPAEEPRFPTTPKDAAALGSALAKLTVRSNASLPVGGVLVYVTFLLPPAEVSEGRGFALAIYQELKKNRFQPLLSSSDAIFGAGAVSFKLSASKLVLLKGETYDVVLYADTRATPAPAAPFTMPSANPAIPTPGSMPQSGSKPSS